MKPMKRISEFELEIERHGSMQTGATIFASERIRLEQSAVAQLIDGASIPGVRRALATPDIHQGYGVPIGCVLGAEGVVVPAAVGFDINCGMRVLTTSLQASEVDVESLAASTRRDVPLGEGKTNVSFQRRDLEAVLAEGVAGLREVKRRDHKVWRNWDDSLLKSDMERIEEGGSLRGDPAAVSARAADRGRNQLGTLGGGNHFIEFQIVSDIAHPKLADRFGLRPGQLVVMIHSGSRGLGHQVGGEYMKLAAKRTGGRSRVAFLELGCKEGRSYVGAMNAAANYAFVNRHLLGKLVESNIRHAYPEARTRLLYDVPHNIAKFEDHGGERLLVHRKGATRAFGPRRMAGTGFADSGQPALVPGSMGTASYVLAGVDGSERSLSSVNHGAGRAMSRSEAAGKWRKGKMVRAPAVSDEEFARSMEGVLLLCESLRSAREEAPKAYKDIDLVMETVLGAGLGAAVARTRPLAVLKG